MSRKRVSSPETNKMFAIGQALFLYLELSVKISSSIYISSQILNEIKSDDRTRSTHTLDPITHSDLTYTEAVIIYLQLENRNLF